VPVGYSRHETGLPSSIAAAALGACAIERHITLDRSMWGSDHAASLEPNGITRLVRDIRLIEKSMGDGFMYARALGRPVPALIRLKPDGHYLAGNNFCSPKLSQGSLARLHGLPSGRR